MKIGAATGCHQLYERSFNYRGYQFPICARCTGLLIGQIVGLVLCSFSRYFQLSTLFLFAILFTIILGIDGVGQLIGLWVSTNLRRLFTGLFCGFFVTFFVSAFVFVIMNAVAKYNAA